MLPPAPQSAERAIALFLDLDGTLVEIADRPELAHAPDGLLSRLALASQRLNGALAVVSGRTLASLDAVLSPLILPAAGTHGLECRLQAGHVEQPDAPELPTAAREQLSAFAAAHQGLLIEHKGQTVAVHYRLAPELGPLVRDSMEHIRTHQAPGFHLQTGKMVIELRPDGVNKGTAIDYFMRHAPFAGCLPVFVGDDVTDEDGFAAINALGGWPIRVGDGDADTQARYCLPTVSAVAEWINMFCLEDPRNCA